MQNQSFQEPWNLPSFPPAVLTPVPNPVCVALTARFDHNLLELINAHVGTLNLLYFYQIFLPDL